MSWRRTSSYVPAISFIVLGIVCAGLLWGRPVDHAAAATAYSSGNNRFDESRFAEAAADYQEAIALDPQFAEAYHNLALADELVDRQKAIKDWQRFIEVAGQNAGMKFDVARAQARLQLEQHLPELPDAMLPAHYVFGAGDYYWEIAEEADGKQWKTFPVGVFLGAAPAAKWIEGTREAFNIWQALFPLQIVADSQHADIRVVWDASPQESGHAGEETEWVRTVRVDDQLVSKRVCNISVDWQAHNWTKDEMRAIILHEMGHALGLGHSDSAKDLMFWQIKDKKHQVYVPVSPLPIFWRSLVKEPSKRDINTLIRLYNSPGLAKRMQ